MRKSLGQLETLFFAYTQMRKLQTVRTADLAAPLGITAKQERELLGRMARSGLIAQVRRGLYLLPPQLPLGGKWTPDDALALNTLMEDQEGRYQICGPNAFNRYGFDEQIPARVYAYNNRLSGERTIGTVALTLIEVADVRLGGTEEAKTTEGKVVYSSRARTLVDAVYDWSRFNSLPRAYEWIRMELASKRVTPAELAACTIKYGNQGTIRRIGALLEQLGAEGKVMTKLQRSLVSSTSLIPWIPNRPGRGTINRRWGVIRNEQE
jgi:predicted transcriptional regulator of viral defense system